LGFISVKRNLRKRFGPGLQRLGHATGLMHLDARLRGRSGAVAFMYHSVADDDTAQWIDPRSHVPATVFAQQMAWLAANRTVVSLQQLVEWLRSGEAVPDGTVVLTFDDGYLDNLTVAAPILARYGLPATLFLPSGYIDRGETQWVDQVYTAFKRRRSRWLDFQDFGDVAAAQFDLDDPAGRHQAYLSICGLFIKEGYDSRCRMLGRLREQLDPDVEPPRLGMDWNDVRSLLATWEGFSIGGHTAEHTDVSAVSDAVARREIEHGAARIADETNERPRYFSFCYSRTTEAASRLLSEAGFEAAFGQCSIEPAIKPGSDLFNLPRVEAPCRLTGYDLAASAINGGIWRRLAQ
jgi:peptidoglycan/xylan/chitin deacetylase (PgdA/CDA1 family)